MKSFIKKRWYLILLILIVVVFISYGRNSASSGKEKVESYTVKRENLREVLSLTGEINADERVSLKFQTSGRLAWVGVKEGDYVKKYQTLATLDKRDIQNRLDKYLNTYSISRNNFEQGNDEFKVEPFNLSETARRSAERALENNQFSLSNTVLDVEYQNLSLEYSNLWTPIEGIVTHVATPFAGVNITPAGAEFEVVNPKTLYFSVTAEQGDVINIKEGMKGKINFDAYPEKKYNGEVYYVSFSPKDGETGTVYEVRLKLDEKAMMLPLRLKMTGDLEFLLKERDGVLSIPSSYLKKDKKGSYVYTGSDKKKVKQYIDYSEEVDGKYIITDGLTENTVIYD